MASTGSKNVLILGGNGKTAKALTSLLAKKEYKIYSVIRQESQASAVSALGAQPVIQDLEKATVEDLSRIINDTKSNIIVWAAGAGYGDPSAPERVDHQAAVRTYDAAAQSSTGKRVIVVSALDVRDRNKAAPDWYNDADKAGSERLWKVLDPYMHAKLAADKDLVTRNAERELKWTIIRPGRLIDDSAVGKIDAGRIHFGKAVTREDVAAVVIACMENDSSIGLAFDLVGGDTDVEDAVAHVGKRREDCFEGFY